MAIATERRAEVSVTVGGREMTFETGQAREAGRRRRRRPVGDTMVLATAQGRMEPREGADFFPLTVDVEERMYAAGRSRAASSSARAADERAILTARMIDRPIRPLWPKGYKNETQVICTVLSADLITAHDILCINGASAALMISPMRSRPGRRRADRDHRWVARREPERFRGGGACELDSSSSVRGRGPDDVEAGDNQVSEERLLEALDLAHSEIRKLCDAQLDLQQQAARRSGSTSRHRGDRAEHATRSVRDQRRGPTRRDAVVEELGELSMTRPRTTCSRSRSAR
jgi:polyribonucleotide nucleotidyltransferase